MTFNAQEAARNLRRREQERCRANLELWRRAKADSDAIVAHLIRTYRPRRILQWGSILEPERFTPRSDIDLAIEGIADASTYFAILGDILKMTEFRVDLVQMEKIAAEFADLIREKSVVLYELPTKDA